MADYLFSNGTIVDGTGDAPFLADILTHDNRIVRIGRNLSAPGATLVECTSLTLTPGFIDSHTLKTDTEIHVVAYPAAMSSRC